MLPVSVHSILENCLMRNNFAVKTRLLLIFLFIFTTGLFASGSNEKPAAAPQEVFEKVVYTDADRKRMEIKNIEKLSEEKTPLALWRSYLMLRSLPEDKDALDLYNRMREKMETVFKAAVEKEDWTTALSCFNSVRALEPTVKTFCGWNEETLKSSSRLFSEYVNINPSREKVKVSRLINGTVTVLVDLGLKVQSGVGYPNKVLGSGFFIDKRGYLITNHHVIENMVDPTYEGYSRLYITLPDNPDDRIPAKVISWDSSLDLALLKVEITPPYVFSLGSSENLDVGDRIYAIGSPVGLERTLTSGIVSAVDRPLLATGRVMQIDAAINSGNSGGPLIDEYGNVQGIVFAGITGYEGLNFAIPVEYLKMNLERMYKGNQINHVWTGSFGMTKRTEALRPDGLEVLYTMPGSSAYVSELKNGDIITAIDGKSIKTLEEFQDVLLSKPLNTIARVSCRTQDNDTKEFPVYLAQRPENPGYEVYQHDSLANAFLPLFGMEVSAGTSSGKAKKFFVKSVLTGSPGEDSGFAPNDSIEVTKSKFSDDKSYIMTEVYAKKRRNGFMGMWISLANALDTPNYF